MLTALLAALVIGQSTMPTAHPSTWDGVPGSDVIQTDPETGEITYPMGQQPPDALALRCVFGRSNVRCPKPIDHEAEAAEMAAALEDWRNAGAGSPGDSETRTPDMAGRLVAEEAPTGTELDKMFLTGFDFEAMNFENDKYAEQEPEPPARVQSGCRREEYRSQDGTSSSFRVICGSGDQRLLDDVMGRLNPD